MNQRPPPSPIGLEYTVNLLRGQVKDEMAESLKAICATADAMPSALAAFVAYNESMHALRERLLEEAGQLSDPNAALLHLRTAWELQLAVDQAALQDLAEEWGLT